MREKERDREREKPEERDLKKDNFKSPIETA